MRIVTAEQMREIDRQTIDGTASAAGVRSSLELMEHAAEAVARAVQELYPAAKRVVVVCGRGNNGGDGIGAARKLAERGCAVTIVATSDQQGSSADAQEMWKRAAGLSSGEPKRGDEIEIIGYSGRAQLTALLADRDVVVDALLGTGARLPLAGEYLEIVGAVNACGKPVIAVDLPSGADADDASDGDYTRANAVVTFTAPKRWHAFSKKAEVPTLIAQIGSPKALIETIACGEEAFEMITSADIPHEFFTRAVDSNKGSYGHVLVVGGSQGKAGAPAMSAMAALRSGAGLATVAAPGAVAATVAGFSPELMTETLDGRDAESVGERALAAVEALAKGKSVVAVGPGLGRAPGTEAFVQGLVRRSEIPIVLDADGLNAFEGGAALLRERRAELVITPHPGEMARLTGLSVAEIQSRRIEVAQRFAREQRCTVVLKGWRTVVAFADGEVWINPTGSAALSKGGTGDVLTGMVAAMLAQHSRDPQQALLAAVYLHGYAGEIVAAKMGMQGLLATDLIAAIPQAFLACAAEQKNRDGFANDVWLHRVRG